MSNWIENVSNKLKELSENKHDFKKAIAEWFYYGEVNDLEQDREDCELCGHPEIRYQFEIKNNLTENSLQIGSECIKKFNLTSIDNDGFWLNPNQTKIKVDKDKRTLIRQSKESRTIRLLAKLSALDDEFNLSETLNYYTLDRECFSPKYLKFIFWRFKKVGVPVDKKLFKVSLRRNREKEQIREMEAWELKIIKPSFTKQQLNLVRSLTDLTF